MPVQPSDHTLSIHLLGPFEVCLEDRVIVDRSWPRAKAKALLKILALQPGRSMHRERLVDLLWPDLEANAGAANLRKALHHIRNAFRAVDVDTPVSVSADGIVSLSPDVQIDTERFHSAARRASLTADSPIMYEGALAVYGGDLLPDDVYEEWAVRPRDELRRLRTTLLLELASAYNRKGQPGHAIERLTRLLSEDSLNEAAHRSLIESYALNGNQDRAIQQYDTLRTLLRDELNAQPSELTEHLVRDVRLGRIAPNRLSSPGEESPPVHFATTSDGVDIAYWSLGSGPVIVDTFSMPHTHIAREWEMAEWRKWYKRLARNHRLVRYDGRGSGLSMTASTPNFTIEEQVRDIEAVVEHVGIKKFALLGQFHLGPAAIAYAAQHPEQVTHLVLWCTYVRGRDFYLPEQVPAMRQIVENDYDLYVTTSASTHVGWSGNDDLLRRFTAFFYESTRPDLALAAIDAVAGYDVSELLPALDLPTLIIHYREAPWLSVENARRLHEAIPSARLALFDGNSAVSPFTEDPEAAANTIESFVSESPRAATASTRLVPMPGDRS